MSLNPYNADQCKSIIINNYDSALEKKYSRWKVNDYRKIYTFDDIVHGRQTPRYSTVISVIPCASFYYLHYLVELQPDKIVDIGCGMNFFKDIIPGVVGIDFNGTEIDIQGFFDTNFSIKHENQFSCAFSIDAMHFIPITEFYNRVMEFKNIIKTGGRGYIAMNVARMVEYSEPEILLELFNTTEPSSIQLAMYIDCEIKKLPIQWLVIDNLIVEKYDECIDGNIRLVFEK